MTGMLSWRGRLCHSYVMVTLAALIIMCTMLQYVLIKWAAVQSQTLRINTDVQVLHTHNTDILDIRALPVYQGVNIKLKPNIRPIEKQFYLTAQPIGRLGNTMFQYASMLGISHSNYMRPVWPGFNLLRNYFHLNSTEITEALDDLEWEPYMELASNVYDEATEGMNNNVNVILIGFFQSWKYFSKHQHELKKHFRFQEEIVNLARGYLLQAYEESYGIENVSFSSITFIGVHIRRGDMLYPENREKGYTVATAEYLETAMIFYTSRHKHPLFIICSDDMPWSKKNIPQNIRHVAFSIEHHDIEDLAILSLCNHTVMTVGTYGWWAGWLAGGTVLYYADFPERNSDLEKEFTPSDFYPSNWKRVSYRLKRNN